MNRTEYLRQLDELLELEPGTLQGDETLEDLDGWGSLAVLGYMAVVNENYGFIVSPTQINSCLKVSDLLDLAANAPPDRIPRVSVFSSSQQLSGHAHYRGTRRDVADHRASRPHDGSIPDLFCPEESTRGFPENKICRWIH